MKIIFKDIAYNSIPLVWEYDEKLNEATWSGAFANGSKSTPGNKFVLQNLHLIEGIEVGERVFIKDALSFFKTYSPMTLPELKDVQATRSPRGVFFRASGSPSIKVNPCSSSSPYLAESENTVVPTHAIGLDALIPENHQGLSSLWRSTRVYEAELLQKTDEDRQKRQYHSIKTERDLTKELMYIKTACISPIKGRIIASLRHLFDDLLAPIQSKLAGEDATPPELITYFRCVIQEIMKESSIDLCLKEMALEEKNRSQFHMGESTKAVQFEYTMKSLRNASIRLKLAPFIFFTHEWEVVSDDLTANDQLKRHLELLKSHTQAQTQFIKSATDHLEKLLRGLGEAQCSLHITEMELASNISSHKPVGNFLSFHALIVNLLKPITIHKVKSEKINKDKSEQLLHEFRTRVIHDVMAKFKQISTQPNAEGQIAGLYETDLDFYISDALYARLSANLTPLFTEKQFQKTKTREQLIDQTSETVARVINAYLEELAPDTEVDNSSSPTLSH
jgi:hypothetical protein